MNHKSLTKLEQVIIAYYRGTPVTCVTTGQLFTYMQGHAPDFDPSMVWEVTEPTVSIGMTRSEMIVLHSLLRRVGGDPATSWRKHTERLRRNLVLFGVPYMRDEAVSFRGGSIYAEMSLEVEAMFLRQEETD